MRRVSAGIGILLTVSLVAGACSARSGDTGPRRNPNLITTAELDASGHQDAFTVVQSLRPQWLRVRGASSVNTREIVRVYLDGSMLGGTDHLRQLSTHSIESIRYLDGLEASQRWGLDHGAGAIVVTTRVRPNEPPACCD